MRDSARVNDSTRGVGGGGRLALALGRRFLAHGAQPRVALDGSPHEALLAQSTHSPDQDKIIQLSKQLADREQQVAVLKDMLSSTRCEVKQKGIDLARVQLALRKRTSPKRVLNKKV